MDHLRAEGFVTPQVSLRDMVAGDLPIFFEQQLDGEAGRMAAFTAKDPRDRAAFDARWAKILAEPSIRKATVLVDGRVAGQILGAEQFGRPSVCYWIGREFWGKGVATAALREFLARVETRPIYARAAADNAASIRVLGKCGFVECERDRGFAVARGEEIEEVVMRLG